MLKEEEFVKLNNDRIYYVVSDLGELEGYEGKFFYLMMAVNDDGSLNSNDIRFFETYVENGTEMIAGVEEGTELFKILQKVAVINHELEYLPGFADELNNCLEKNKSGK